MAKKRYSILLVPAIYNSSSFLLPHPRRVARNAALAARLAVLFHTDPDLTGIVVDEQVRFIEEILAVVPDLAVAIREAVQDGRLVIGPWYVSTLGALVSGEALLRNLEFGLRSVDTLGNSQSKISFASPTGNFVRQLPQILNSCGVELAITEDLVWVDSLYSTLVGPDGTELTVVGVRLPRLSVAMAGTDEKTLREAIVEARDALKPLQNSSVQVAMYPIEAAMGAAPPIQNLSSATKRLRSADVEQGSLSDFLGRIKTNFQPDVESIIATSNLIPYVPYELDGVLSSRIWIAQENAELQNLLECWSEPLSAWANFVQVGDIMAAATAEIRVNLIEQAWKVLLQNQAYPEISGAWVDDLEHAIRHRFEEVRHLGEEILDQSLAIVASAVDSKGSQPSHAHTALIVFNTNGTSLTDHVSTRLVLDESLWPFEILDSLGETVPFQVANYELTGNGLEVDVDLFAESVPGIGYRTYYIVSSHEDSHQVPITDEGLSCANEFFEVTVDPQTGTLSILDLERNLLYDGLNHFVDSGDAGDCLRFEPISRDTVIDIAANTPLSVIRKVSQLGESLEYFQIYRLPIQLAEDGESRLPLAAQFAPFSIRTQVYVTHGIKRVDVDVEISNDARDHRMRVHFPMPFRTTRFWANSQFEVALLQLDDNDRTGAEPRSTKFAFHGFATASGKQSGLTIAGKGLPEGEILEAREQSEIRLTLLRSVGKVQNSVSGEIPSHTAQCTGTFTYEYSLIPHGVDVEEAWAQARAFANPMYGMQVDLHEGSLPSSAQLVGCESHDFVVSAVKATHESDLMLVRGYSTSPQPQEVSLSIGIPVTDVTEVSLRGDIIEGAAFSLTSSGIHFVAQPHQIKTFLLRIARS